MPPDDLKRIGLPEKLELHSVLTFARRLDALGAAHSIEIDMGPQRYFPPFPMLFVAAKIMEFRERNPQCVISIKNALEHTYAAHMGFFRAAGLDVDLPAAAESAGNARYLPVRTLRRADLQQSATDRFLQVGALVERHANDIAKVVSRDETQTSDFYSALAYSLREMMRNVFEHSECDRLFYCAQYWPAKAKAEFCLLDRGIGIRQSLGTNPNFRLKTDKEALEMCLWPGVSGKTHLPADSEWANSGYGLYMTSRLARHGGNFLIASGDAVITLSNSLGKQNLETKLQGTAIRVNLDTTKIGDVEARLEQFRKEAPAIAAERGIVVRRGPSYMSMVLRRDFQGLKG